MYVPRVGGVMRFTLKFELAAADLARARAWYSDVLGLEPVEPVEPDAEQLVYRVEGIVFGIYASENAGTNKATAARLVVDDFDVAHAELLSKGVVFEDYDLGPDFCTVDGVLTSPDGERTSWFKDSEGNILALGSSL
jgi:catechol 2,3-dioxygenase-like lactoylglutathione lyase family enzyme